jgi:hypothetical protein
MLIKKIWSCFLFPLSYALTFIIFSVPKSCLVLQDFLHKKMIEALESAEGSEEQNASSDEVDM